MAILHMQVSKSQFKSKALELFRQVEADGRPIVITDHGQPKLEVRRFRAPKRTPTSILRGSVLRYERPTDSVDEDAWDAAR